VRRTDDSQPELCAAQTTAIQSFALQYDHQALVQSIATRILMGIVLRNAIAIDTTRYITDTACPEVCPFGENELLVTG
jgi:hypothetical protein